MIALSIHLDGENCWPDLKDAGDRVIHLSNDAPAIQLAALEKGMTSGRTSLCIRIDLPDGKIVMAETTLRLFLTAAAAFIGKFPEEAHDAGFNPGPRQDPASN